MNYLRGAHGVVDRRYRHEHQADREQHLVEMALAVDVNVKRALEQKSEQRRGEKGDRQAEQKRNAEAVHGDEGDVAAGHGEGAVREIDEVHQPERDGEPAGEHEQEHAVGDAIEQNGQHGRCSPTQ